ncbi:CTP:molybdopterin cytidylyltransferase [Klebsiella michiganensis]|nr:CTP:molybdopterin cytidylyltransferase [Klebsiella michiganensis]
MSKKMDKQCVMLAAGLSSRMGKWKMMMPWGEGTILDSALASALAFCDRVVLVTGFRGDELAACYRDHPGVEVVFNPQYQDGMFSSIQCGVGHIRASRFFLALGDMPEVHAPASTAGCGPTPTPGAALFQPTIAVKAIRFFCPSGRFL